MSSKDIKKRRGRPTLDAASQLNSQIEHAAKKLFVTKGFRQTSIDEIANAAAVSKRTLYARFSGKLELFRLVASRHLEGHFRKLECMDVRSGDLRSRLNFVAAYFVESALSTESVALDRIVLAESDTFPELAHFLNEQGHERAINIVRKLLDADPVLGGTVLEDQFIAEALYSILVLTPIRRASIGTPGELEPSVTPADAVELLLRIRRHAKNDRSRGD